MVEQLVYIYSDRTGFVSFDPGQHGLDAALFAEWHTDTIYMVP